jgi:hypothetical protein
MDECVVDLIEALWFAWWSPPGEVSDSGCWCAYSQGYLYIARTRLGLAWQVATEWRNDRHLAG